MRVFQAGEGDPSAHSIPLELWLCMEQGVSDHGSARNQIWGCCFVVIALCCWVSFGVEALESLESGACKKSGDVLSRLPGWQESVFGGEMDEGANFGS